jgi:hypothetical protein
MELVQHNGPVAVAGAAKTMGFGIANNKKMFRILSDNLYQDKPGSIVREISCNALDAHTMGGNTDEAFAIHLPDQFEPWFAVRDFGVGLSPEAVEKIFCVYGESTKDQSNDAIGAFGLGAKTPFAYSDQFNVTSYLDGTVYVYSAYIAENGLPQLALVVEAPTDERNGVEVKIGVKPEDFARFITATRTQLRFFPVKPTIQNNKSFTWLDEPTVLFETATIRVFKSGGGYGASRINIVQGPVGYPLDFNQIAPHLSSEDTRFLRTISDVGANLFFPIGNIGVTASREGVEYKGVTIDNIKRVISQAHKDVIAWAEKEIASLKTPWEKAVFINENTTFRNIISGIQMDLSPAEKARGGGYTFNLGGADAYNVKVEEVGINGTKHFREFSGAAITEYTRSSVSGFTGSRYSSNDATLEPRSNMKVAVVIRSADDTRKPVARMRHFFTEKGLERMYCMAMHSSITVDKKFVEAVRKHIGGFTEIYLVADMADPPKAVYTSTRADYSKPTAYKANSNGRDDMDSVANWNRVYTKLGELENDAGDDLERAVYVTVDRQRVESLPYDVKRMYAELCHAGVVDAPLFAVRTADVPKLAGTPTEWVKLEDYVAEKKAEVMANPNIRRYSVANAMNEAIETIVGTRLSGLTGLSSRTRLGRLMRVKEKASAIATASKVNHAMLRIAGYDADQHPALKIVRENCKTAFDRIPMARMLARAGYGRIEGDEATHLVEYINHFDR